MLPHVGSALSFCQFSAVRTMESAPVMTPRPMRAQRPNLERKLIWTRWRIRMGKVERKKSEIMEITAC